MNILVLGGTRFFGVHMVQALLDRGYQVTIATRGNAKDAFGDKVSRILVDRTDPAAMAKALSGKYYDVICDNIAYSSRDVKNILDITGCGRYILTSSCSVYENLHPDIKEREFDPYAYPLQWCSRGDFSYDEIKRQAECALFQVYNNIPGMAIRFPYVIGEDDYTKRLYFYVEHVIRLLPMKLDNIAEDICFISSSEAGAFIARAAEQEADGAVNACCTGTITLREVLNYVEQKTGKKPILVDDGEEGPYNGTPSFYLNTTLAGESGYQFTSLKSWVYELLDNYIRSVGE